MLSYSNGKEQAGMPSLNYLRYTTIPALMCFCLIGCQKAPSDGEVPLAEAPSNLSSAPESGIDFDGMDTSIAPGDDFFLYANGRWYRDMVIPSDRGAVNTPSIVVDRSWEQIRTIVDELSVRQEELNETETMVARFYRAFMDVDAINQLELSPLQPWLKQIDEISTREQLTAFLGQAWLYGFDAPISTSLQIDRQNPDRYQINIDTGGLGLPDRDYYLEDSPRFLEAREAYLRDIASLLSFSGRKESNREAQSVLDLETKIASYLWPREQRRNDDLTLNPTERSRLEAEYVPFDWAGYLTATGFTAPSVNITTPDALKAAIALVEQADLDAWKAYLRYHIVAGHAEYLSDEIREKHFEFAGRALNGQQEPEPRWRRAIRAMSGTRSVGFPLARLYVERHFPEDSKQQMIALVENVREALKQRIENIEWMGETTRANALAKLAAFRPKIGYPDVWPAVDSDLMRDDELVGNLIRLREFHRADDIARELQPTDRDRWNLAPHQVNAYYQPQFNQIVFTAAILQPPLFDPNADAAANYGAIGHIIGHEMGHGFDDQGSKFDANGVQRNWWTDEDRAAFEERTRELVTQYSAYEPIPGNHINGENSLGENIGDVGGMGMAHQAYHLSLEGQEAPIIDGLTGDQRFFLAYTQTYREKRTEASMLRAVRGGVHSPFRYRSLAVRNHDAWYEAFDIKPGDGLYLPPEKRVRIW